MTDISELNALRARIDQLEAQAASEQAERDEQRAERFTTRRGMLRLAGAAAVGGVAAAVAGSGQVAAAGDLATDSTGNTATSPTGLAAIGGGTVAYGIGVTDQGVTGPHADLGRPALFGHAIGTAFTNGVAGQTTGGGTGVYGLHTGGNGAGRGVKGMSTEGVGVEGVSENHTGVWGRTTVGNGVLGTNSTATGALAYGAVGVYGQGTRGALQLGASGLTSPVSRVTSYPINTLETDEGGNVYFCYEAGTPGKWRKLAGPATGGAFHPITPTRVYDSRAAAPTPGLLIAGNNRLVSVADGRDNNGTATTTDLVPVGATAVAANITVTGTTGTGGFLAVNPGGVTTVGASTINWFGAGQNIANGVTLTLNATRELTVICGDGGGSTHFIIDIAGYYL